MREERAYTSLYFFPWDTINTGPGTRGPGTQGPGTQGPEDPRTGDPGTRGPGTQGPRFLRAVLDCSSSNTTVQAISANATCLTHNDVLYVVAMHTEGVIYSRQRYYLTFLILRVVYCQFCKARLAHRHDTQSESGDYSHFFFFFFFFI